MVKYLTTDAVLTIHYALVDIFREAGDPIDHPGPDRVACSNLR